MPFPTIVLAGDEVASAQCSMRSSTARRAWLFGLLLIGLLRLCNGAAAFAQSGCLSEWLPGDGLPGTNGTVYAQTMWDPDGAGPQSPRLVLGGSFTIAGNAVANHIAVYDPATGHWAALGSGMDGDVFSLAALPNGDLVAGGFFGVAGGNAANSIARWNGSSWSAMGSGDGLYGVKALAALPNGDVIAGGVFETAGGVWTYYIGRWDGTVWTALGSGLDGEVYALATLPNGDVVAGGAFDTAGGVPASRVARWNGTSWSALGSGTTGTNGTVVALASLPNGDVVAGGDFSTVGGVSANRIAKWNGTSWSPLGSGMSEASYPVRVVTPLPNGDLVAGGFFTAAGGVPANSVARWNGTSWSALGAELNSEVFAVTVLPSGDLVAGHNDWSHYNLSRWNGASWVDFAAGMHSEVGALATIPGGDVVAGGDFKFAEGVPNSPIARWNGASWSAMGPTLWSGTTGPAGVIALQALANGEIIAGGDFTAAAGVAANSIARWNGQSWSALGSGITGPENHRYVFAIATMPNGDLVAGGNFTAAGGVPVNNVARWNGQSWSAMGTGIPGTNSAVWALAVLANGDLVAGGSFTTAGGAPGNCIARWNGASWLPLSTGVAGNSVTAARVTALTTLPNGDLVAGGFFGAAGGVPVNSIARWNGTSWSPMGSLYNDYVTALCTLPNGNVVAGRSYNDTLGFHGIMRWDGTSWLELGSGVDGYVNALTTLPNGDLVAGGSFLTAGGGVSAYFAQCHFGPPVPAITTQPHYTNACRASTATFSVITAGSDPCTYQWRKGGQPINTAVGGNPSAATATLSLAGVQPPDAGTYDCVVSNACASVTSAAARLDVDAADVGSQGGVPGRDGVHDNNDFIIFISYFFLQQAPADRGGTGGVPGPDGEFDNNDFIVFIDQFFAGC